VKVCLYPDPVLRELALPVNNIGLEEIQTIDAMLGLVIDPSTLGIAANQVGVLKRVIVVDIPGRGLTVLINPTIISSSGKFQSEEGCISLPGRKVMVKRKKFIKVQARDRDGKFIAIKERSLIAACIQHEIDHLNGRLIIDYIK